MIPDAELLCSSHAWSLQMYAQCYMPLFIASYQEWMHIMNSVVQTWPYFVQSKIV